MSKTDALLEQALELLEDSEGGYDLRLMSPVEAESDIPTEGKSLIIVADVRGTLHFRIIEADGRRAVDTDESEMAEKAAQFAELKQILSGLWQAPQLFQRDKDRVVDAVTSIAGHTLEGQLKPWQWIGFATRCLMRIRAIAWRKTDGEEKTEYHGEVAVLYEKMLDVATFASNYIISNGQYIGESKLTDLPDRTRERLRELWISADKVNQLIGDKAGIAKRIFNDLDWQLRGVSAHVAFCICRYCERKSSRDIGFEARVVARHTLEVVSTFDPSLLGVVTRSIAEDLENPSRFVEDFEQFEPELDVLTNPFGYSIEPHMRDIYEKELSAQIQSLFESDVSALQAPRQGRSQTVTPADIERRLSESKLIGLRKKEELLQESRNLLRDLEGKTTGTYQGNKECAEVIMDLVHSGGGVLLFSGTVEKRHGGRGKVKTKEIYENVHVYITCDRPQTSSFRMFTANKMQQYVRSFDTLPSGLVVVRASDLPVATITPLALEDTPST